MGPPVPGSHRLGRGPRRGADKPWRARAGGPGNHDGAVRIRSKEAARLLAPEDARESTSLDGRAWRPARRVAWYIRTPRPDRSRRGYVLAQNVALRSPPPPRRTGSHSRRWSVMLALAGC